MIGSEGCLGKTVISDDLWDFFVFPTSVTEKLIKLFASQKVLYCL